MGAYIGASFVRQHFNVYPETSFLIKRSVVTNSRLIFASVFPFTPSLPIARSRAVFLIDGGAVMYGHFA